MVELSLVFIKYFLSFLPLSMQITTLQVSLSHSSWLISIMNQSPMSTTAAPLRKLAWMPWLEVTTSSIPSLPHPGKRSLPCNPCHPQAVPWMDVRDAEGLAMVYTRLLCRTGAVVAIHSALLSSEQTAVLGRELQAASPTPHHWHLF